MSNAEVALFTPFWFEGILVGGRVFVSSVEDWLTGVIEPYARIFSAPDLPLGAVLLRYDLKGIPIFTVEQRTGLSLRTWADTHELGLVISVGNRVRVAS